MDGAQKSQKEEKEDGRRRRFRKADASLWTPVCRSRHPLFIAEFLVLQPGVGHRIAPDEDGGGRTDVRRRVMRS